MIPAAAGPEGTFKERSGGGVHGAWASCDAMEPGAGRGQRGFRARWASQARQPEGLVSPATIDFDEDSRSAWEQVGLMDEVEDLPEEEARGSTSGPSSDEDPWAAEQRARERLEAANRDLQEAIQLATAEELEGYWEQLPKSVRELVTMNGEVSADLLTYIADDDAGRMELLRQHGCEEMVPQGEGHGP